ncbi:molecular chaperone [Chitinophaga qingshengii]|uniref:Molecular chaperone n=1 Tax=Chitinophaga qingshengii TaxID=1569794 RepID=A0ABR7TFN4_9BACT|nr:molecular chaperone [Chitinophaga qingshengii]MBC9929176.1 molecular chaperone [Chitinophaga qingshengii]
MKLLTLRVQRRYEIVFRTALIVSTFLMYAAIVHAQGDLMIYPKRVVFDGTKRTQDLGLANTGTDTATYQVSFVQIRMKEDGSFENIEQPDSGQSFASNNLRIFPRTVTIAPKESQAVKLQVINTGSLPPGEYRSHVYFRAVPRPIPLGEAPLRPKDTSNIEVKLVPVFGVTIPVIIRVGADSTTTTITEMGMDFNNPKQPQVSFALNRNGNMSAYGDLTIDYISPSGQRTRAAMAKGVAVYTPLNKRKVKIDLDNTSKLNYHQGKLEVNYETGNGKPVMLAKQELVLR